MDNCGYEDTKEINEEVDRLLENAKN